MPIRTTAVRAVLLIIIVAMGLFSMTSRKTSATEWGIAGGYSGLTFEQLKATGASYAVAEMDWSNAEPAPGVFEETYLQRVKQEVTDMRKAGLKVVLNFGMHVAPKWLLSQPGARFMDQTGHVYTATPEPNLVWNRSLRTEAEAYVHKVFSIVGDDVDVVRVGGGHWGELKYPREEAIGKGSARSYWAFDQYAVKNNPVPGWTPGTPSPNGEAARFLNWYLDALVEYQNWQVWVVQKYYSGIVAVLYPSWGMRPGDFEAAVRTNLNGSSSVEVNREVQSGLDHARAVGQLSATRTAVWCTWADAVGTDPNNPPPMNELATLAAARGIPLMGENGGGATTVADIRRTDALAHGLGVRLMIWVRLDTLLAGSAKPQIVRDADTAQASLEDFRQLTVS